MAPDLTLNEHKISSANELETLDANGAVVSVSQLPSKQREVLERLVHFVHQHQYPPSIQQLCDLCGVSSTSTIHHHISALKKKGFIHWNPTEKRAITIREDVRQELTPEDDDVRELKQRHQLPMLGRIAAGQPLTTIEDSVEQFDLAEDICPEGCYALKVRGYSMIEDHIMDEDIVIINPKSRVRDGDVVVALVEGQSATLKRIFREKDRVRLQPANSEMEPIYAKDVEVQGKVEAIIRCL
ncbi:MAG: transcriptional repressor LexA [Vampirovibrionales bacterium]|nr:transcriptional repressor LexA [Vampirovibrionales bacterium]